MSVEIRPAQNSDAAQVSSILTEAVSWLNSIHQPLWQYNDFSEDKITGEVRSGLYFIAWMNGEAVGVLRFQLEDKMFWPDIPDWDSTFIHCMAVKRKVAGTGVSGQMLDWAKMRTKQLTRKFLRLDCVPRPKLCAFYERHGFIKHSEFQVGPYTVNRYECDIENCEWPNAADGNRCEI